MFPESFTIDSHLLFNNKFKIRFFLYSKENSTLSLDDLLRYHLKEEYEFPIYNPADYLNNLNKIINSNYKKYQKLKAFI